MYYGSSPTSFDILFSLLHFGSSSGMVLSRCYTFILGKHCMLLKNIAFLLVITNPFDLSKDI